MQQMWIYWELYPQSYTQAAQAVQFFSLTEADAELGNILNDRAALFRIELLISVI